MSLSEFTKINSKIIKKYKYILDKNNLLLLSIKSEREKIMGFIKRNPNIKILINELNNNEVSNLNNKILKFSDTSWVDYKNVMKELDSLTINYKISWNTINDDNINYIYIKSTKKNIGSLLENIKFIIYFIEYLKNKNNSLNSKVNIYLVLTSLKKYFPKNNKIIDVKNVNTGYTDFNENIIFIWRLEEFYKVIFHELIHYFDMDNRNIKVNININIDGPHSYYEAITDFWGIYYHIIFLSIITKIKIKLLLELELTFIRNQAMILNDYLNLDNWKETIPNYIKQKTPAFSYYILKYLIFEYLLENNIFDVHDYNKLLNTIMNNGFKITEYIKIESSRMTLIQIV